MGSDRLDYKNLAEWATKEKKGEKSSVVKVNTENYFAFSTLERLKGHRWKK